MEFIEPILDRLPLWILILICIVWAINRFFYPFYDKYADGQLKNFEECSEKLDEINNKMDAQNIKMDELIMERDALKLEIAALHGSINVLNQVLLEHGINIKL